MVFYFGLSVLENHLTSLSGFFGGSIIITIFPFLQIQGYSPPSRTSWHFRETYYSVVLEIGGILFTRQTVK